MLHFLKSNLFTGKKKGRSYYVALPGLELIVTFIYLSQSAGLKGMSHHTRDEMQILLKIEQLDLFL